MKNNKEKNIIKYYLGEYRVKEMSTLYEFVEKSNTKFDNIAYKDMLKIIKKYSSDDSSNFYSYIIIRNMLREYYDLSCKMIPRISEYDDTKIYKMYDFITTYTVDNIEYKVYIINEFKKHDIIEERSSSEPLVYKIYTKLLQIFSVQYRKGYTRGSEELYDQSMLKTIQNKAKKITNIILKHNNDSILINQEDFVKPTSSVLEIMCTLSDIVVDNEDNLKKLIDNLYKLFWESKIHNYDKNKELNFINNLRRFFYHDLEHGKESEIKKKYKLVGDFYIEALGKSIPSSAKDWQKVQEHIYDLLIDFLEKVEIKELDEEKNKLD